jgi:hypothetical protein
VKDDANGGVGDEDDPPQQEYDAIKDDHDHQGPATHSPPASPLRQSSRDHVPYSYSSIQYVILLSDGSELDVF